MNYLNQLIEKYTNGRCSQEELEQLKAMFVVDDLSELEALLKQDWEAVGQEKPRLSLEKRTSMKASLDAARKEADQEGKVRQLKIVRSAVAIAASILLLFVSFFIFNRPENNLEAQGIEQYNPDLKALPIALSDGSKIWLKTGSKIIYQEPLDKNLRQLELEGEAFFEVAKDPTRPFIVISNNVNTKVLGTSFNVKSIVGDTLVQVTLVEGRVRVETPQLNTTRTDTTNLLPGQQLTYQRMTAKVDKVDIYDDDDYAWKDNIVILDDPDIQDVANELEKWYGVNIKIPDGFTSETKLVHRFDIDDDNIDEVIKGIEAVADYRFEYLGNKQYSIKKTDR
ncbi:MAG: FecR domain-containing protein [Bacteroidota bacterium]